MGSFFYFAYGSNLLVERLRARCPSAEFVGLASASGFGLNFMKRGRDNSGKATIYAHSGRSGLVTGVVYEISSEDLLALNHAEGYGYTRLDQFPVRLLEGANAIETMTYIAQASAIDCDLKPFDWYKALVIAGARQHRLPGNYIETLRGVTSTSDPDLGRAQRLEALLALKRAGVPDYTQII